MKGDGDKSLSHVYELVLSHGYSILMDSPTPNQTTNFIPPVSKGLGTFSFNLIALILSGGLSHPSAVLSVGWYCLDFISCFIASPSKDFLEAMIFFGV